jgi:subtilisin family serine protease
VEVLVHRRFLGRLSLGIVAGALAVAGALPVAAASPARAGEDVIVVFADDGVDSQALTARLASRHGFRARHVYNHALKGFAATLPSAAVDALRRNPNVAYVEADGVAQATTDVDQPITDSGLWGLDRIDERFRSLDGNYTYGQTGSGVTAYILDTGIRVDHTAFGGRAVDGYDSIDGALPANDCHGHGTHVAGTVGGTTYGVAKGVKLVAVRVLNCDGSGTWSGIIAGIDWVTGDHAAGAPAIANMSLGGPGNSAVDEAVTRSINDGVSYAIAAGNGNFIGIAQDACKYSPARVAAAMTVGATDGSDRKASWSNYGKCVDWFAPGVGVKSAWHSSATATHTISGTSMATPHTAGVGALYLQANPTRSPQQVRDAIYGSLTKGIVASSKTTNNHLLCSRFPTCPD